MVTFDSFVNAVIPLIVAIVVGYLMYKPLAPALSGLFGWIGDFFGFIKKKAVGEEGELGAFKSIDFE